MKEFHIHEIANEIDTSDYKIEVQLEVQANADALIIAALNKQFLVARQCVE